MRTSTLPDDFDPRAVIVPGPVVPQVSVPAPAVDMKTAKPEDMPVETTKAHTDASYIDIANEVPTGMSFSANNHLSIRPYRLPEKYKLGAARKGGKIRYIVEAIGATIDRPVMQLPLIDFWFACYWLRTMSYKKDPLAAEWSCEDMAHVRKVYVDELAPETLHNKTIIERANIQVIPIDNALAAIAEQMLEGDLKVYIHPPTVADFLERMEAGDDWDDELSFMADLAVYLRPGVHGKTIVERVKFLRSIVNHPEAEEKMELLKEGMAIIVKAGIKETFEDVCKHCLVKQTVLLEVDLLTFFPV